MKKEIMSLIDINRWARSSSKKNYTFCMRGENQTDHRGPNTWYEIKNKAQVNHKGLDT